jgi:ornithine cyclodeaminase/alanine dehydrogenase-like protein (mu-crystallin family)
MALLLREADVRAVVEMPPVMAAVEAAMRELGEGVAQNQPRRRVFPPGGLLNVMFASYPGSGYYGLKSYSIGSGGVRFLVLLYRQSDGALEALIEANLLGAARTGAASGVAAKHLAPEGAREVALIGSGWQARTQADAVSRALGAKRLRVFSRSPERRSAFARELGEQLGIEVVATQTAEVAVKGAPVVITMTSAAEPVIEADWVASDALVIAAGSNHPMHAEVPPELVASAGMVVVDQLDAARLESGDLLRAEQAGAFEWSKAVELGAVVAGKAPGRPDGGRVLFESHGLAIWDVAAGAVVLHAARERGLGQEIALFEG